jgi:hypothetical protein
MQARPAGTHQNVREMSELVRSGDEVRASKAGSPGYSWRRPRNSAWRCTGPKQTTFATEGPICKTFPRLLLSLRPGPYLHIPLNRNQPKFPSLSSQPLLARSPGRVLILENDVSTRNLLRRLIERPGCASAEIQETHDLTADLKARDAELLVIDVSDNHGRRYSNRACAHSSQLEDYRLVAGSLDGNAIPGHFQVLLKPFALDSFVDCEVRLPGNRPRLTLVFRERQLPRTTTARATRSR